FEEQAARTPDAVAVAFEDRQLTYAELNKKANRLAWRLRALGVGPEIRVCLLLERSAEMIAAMLGALKAGGAYVPLDPAYPEERLSFMIRDSGAVVLLTERHLCARALVDDVRIVYLGDEFSGGEHACAPRDVTAANLAYVIYTSGSTGKPKGIAVTHGGVVNNIVDLNARFAVGPGDNALAVSSPSFDMS